MDKRRKVGITSPKLEESLSDSRSFSAFTHIPPTTPFTPSLLSYPTGCAFSTSTTTPSDLLTSFQIPPLFHKPTITTNRNYH